MRMVASACGYRHPLQAEVFAMGIFGTRTTVEALPAFTTTLILSKSPRLPLWLKCGWGMAANWSSAPPRAPVISADPAHLPCFGLGLAACSLAETGTTSWVDLSS